MNDSGRNNICLNSVHSPAVVAVRNSPLSLEGGITIFVNKYILHIYLCNFIFRYWSVAVLFWIIEFNAEEFGNELYVIISVLIV